MVFLGKDNFYSQCLCLGVQKFKMGIVKMCQSGYCEKYHQEKLTKNPRLLIKV